MNCEREATLSMIAVGGTAVFLGALALAALFLIGFAAWSFE